MGAASVDELLAVESRLTRSFLGCVIVLVARTGWTFFIGPRTPSGGIEPAWVGLVLLILQLGFYVWYALSAGAAAKLLGATGWTYIVWILAAPFLALVPIPIVSTIIGVSPLSIKFLLGGQLQSAVREATFADFHHDS
jgi:hypothetical protein